MTEIVLAALIYAGSFYLDVSSTHSALRACERANAQCYEIHSAFNTGTVSGATIATAVFTAADYGVRQIPRYGKWIAWGLRVGIFAACFNAYRENVAVRNGVSE